MWYYHLLANFSFLIVKSRKLVGVEPRPANYVDMVPKVEPVNGKIDVRQDLCCQSLEGAIRRVSSNSLDQFGQMAHVILTENLCKQQIPLIYM